MWSTNEGLTHGPALCARILTAGWLVGLKLAEHRIPTLEANRRTIPEEPGGEGLVLVVVGHAVWHLDFDDGKSVRQRVAAARSEPRSSRTAPLAASANSSRRRRQGPEMSRRK